MLKIRLQRIGRKNQPAFRLVLTDSKNSTKSGKTLEVLGSHDFRKETTEIKADRVKHWMSVGAKATGTVHNLLLKHEIIKGKKVNVLPKKTVPKVEAKPEATPVEAAGAPVEEAKSEAPEIEEKSDVKAEAAPIEAAAEAKEQKEEEKEVKEEPEKEPAVKSEGAEEGNVEAKPEEPKA
jgi:small subunit ribosomal protein S16